MQIMRKALKYPITISGMFAELGIVSVFSAMSVFMIAISRIPHLKIFMEINIWLFPRNLLTNPIWNLTNMSGNLLKKNTCSCHNIPSVLLQIINVSRKFV